MEELGCREHQNAIALGDVKKAILRKGRTVRDIELQRWREVLDLVGHPITIAVHNRPDFVLFCTHEKNRALWCHCHVPGIRHQGIELNLETSRHLDALQCFPNGISFRCILVDDRMRLSCR